MKMSEFTGMLEVKVMKRRLTEKVGDVDGALLGLEVGLLFNEVKGKKRMSHPHDVLRYDHEQNVNLPCWTRRWIRLEL